MPVYGRIVVIKRNGLDGSSFPLMTTTCLFGRDANCDIRIRLPTVSQKHCRIEVCKNGRSGKAPDISLINLTKTNPVKLNDDIVQKNMPLGDLDIFTIADRHFRWELSKNPNCISPVDGESCESTPRRTLLKRPNKLSKSEKRPMVKRVNGASRKSESPGLKASMVPSGTPQGKKSSGKFAVSPAQLRRSRPSRQISSPCYYGNPILTPASSAKKRKHSTDLQHCSKLPMTRESSPDSKKRKPLVAKEDNTVKIEPPVSPDMKKSAALRTIHAAKLYSNGSSPKVSSTFLKTTGGASQSPAVSKSGSFSSKKRKKLRANRLAATSPRRTMSKITLENTSLLKSEKRKPPNTTSPRNSSLDALKTPDISTETFVSPLLTRSTSHPLASETENRRMMKWQESLLSERVTRSRSLEKEEIVTKRKLINEFGATPKTGQKIPVSPFRDITAISNKTKSARNDLTNAVGVKSFLRSQKSPKNDLTDVRGIKRLMRSPIKSPKNDLTDVRGVKRLMRSPEKSPKNDLTDVRGVKRLMRSPVKSPLNDLTDVVGVKRLMQSQKSPKNDLSDVFGLKRLMKSPEKSPRNDLTDVAGVKRLLGGKQSPKNDLTDVFGLKRLMRSPGRSPKNDLSDVTGVKRLLRTSQSPVISSTNSLKASPSSSEKAKKSKISGIGAEKSVNVELDRHSFTAFYSSPENKGQESLVKRLSMSPHKKHSPSTRRKSSEKLKLSPQFFASKKSGTISSPSSKSDSNQHTKEASELSVERPSESLNHSPMATKSPDSATKRKSTTPLPGDSKRPRGPNASTESNLVSSEETKTVKTQSPALKTSPLLSLASKRGRPKRQKVTNATDTSSSAQIERRTRGQREVQLTPNQTLSNTPQLRSTRKKVKEALKSPQPVVIISDSEPAKSPKKVVGHQPPKAVAKSPTKKGKKSKAVDTSPIAIVTIDISDSPIDGLRRKRRLHSPKSLRDNNPTSYGNEEEVTVDIASTEGDTENKRVVSKKTRGGRKAKDTIQMSPVIKKPRGRLAAKGGKAKSPVEVETPRKRTAAVAKKSRINLQVPSPSTSDSTKESLVAARGRNTRSTATVISETSPCALKIPTQKVVKKRTDTKASLIEEISAKGAEVIGKKSPVDSKRKVERGKKAAEASPVQTRSLRSRRPVRD